MKESPAFTKAYDLLRWLLTTTRKFPRDQRFGLAQRLCGYGFTLQEALVAAALDWRNAPAHLLQADIALANVRKGVLLAHELGFYDAGQYAHVSGLTQETGNLLGSWRKRAEKEGQ
jgi:hypothetical protein